jgi:hypothetical protein
MRQGALAIYLQGGGRPCEASRKHPWPGWLPTKSADCPPKVPTAHQKKPRVQRNIQQGQVARAGGSKESMLPCCPYPLSHSSWPGTCCTALLGGVWQCTFRVLCCKQTQGA